MVRAAFRSGFAGAGLLCVICLPTAALAGEDCRSDAGLASFDTVVDKAAMIVLATATTAEPPLFSTGNALNFEFEVKETLKGRSKRTLKVKAALNDDDPGYPRRDLDAHQRMSFWDRMETRLVHVSSCNQQLNFKLGATYLLIDPGDRLEPMSARYEMIADAENDLWLASVRRMIADSHEAPMTMTIDQYIRAQQSVAFAVMPYCNEKLRAGASRVADLSEPLWGDRVKRDGLHPETFAAALEGCDGFTTLLGIFYQPDQSRPAETPLGVVTYPAQQFVRLDGETIPIDKIRSEVEIVGPRTITLSELVAALKSPKTDAGEEQDDGR